jgi:hypothetical protein
MHRAGCRPSTVCASARRHIFEYEEGPGPFRPRLSFSSIHQMRGTSVLGSPITRICILPAKRAGSGPIGCSKPRSRRGIKRLRA